MTDQNPIAQHTVLYVVAAYPSVSETFVWREVEHLRRLGIHVLVATLRPVDQPASGVRAADITVYGPATAATLWAAAGELVRHPIATAKTLLTAGKDALFPGEPTALLQRLKSLVQAIASIGLVGRLRSESIDHVHAHFAHAPASIAMYSSLQLGKPWSFTGHANDLFQRRHLLRRKLERASGVACISRWHREFYQQQLDNPRSNFEIIRCGVDLPTASTRELFSESSIRIVSVGRLVEKKGFATLVDAYSDLAVRFPGKFRLTIAGDGPMSDVLRRQSQASGALPPVEFTGSLDHAEVKDLVASSDLFVLACQQDASGDKDGIPVVLMEAMAAGIPTISGDIETIRELIQDGENGRLVPGKDTAALADAITDLAFAPDRARALASAGRQRVATEFATAVNLRRLLNLFDFPAGSVTPPPSAPSEQIVDDLQNHIVETSHHSHKLVP
ncbi:glycosyltransferase family 4 protein [Stieleria sp. TO1_6]|uniref:glycosyltransferase family 4 protein n=1 Tax=Stieleria tagensis TaxID=2956795 RepID=UPI00209AE032|nr:glycosyltransferase family 4 protein [Stieleria tagensis]MCO8120671.1 glycosyltransferase family 4 protein [Stieleria tagensis]